ncbi:MAG: hypothetical protein IAG13_04180 [Deltaproteobacteria bacterium]|nr:hypothetical protein [Nannocystaceae bacterium]
MPHLLAASRGIHRALYGIVKPEMFAFESSGAVRRDVVAVLADAAMDASASEAVVRALRERYGDDVMLVPTGTDAGVGALVERVLATLRPKLIVAWGGDALISAIAAAVRGQPVELAIIPSGSQTIARALGIPSARADACAAVRRAAVQDLDVLEADGGVVLARVLFGRFSELERRMHEPRPWLSRAWSMLGELFGYRIGFELEIDGELHRVRATSVIAANAGGIGYGGLQWAPGIEHGDGRFDVVVVHSSTIFDYAALLWSWGTRRPRARQVTHLRVHRQLRVRARRPVSVTLDGRHTEASELTISLAAKPLRMVFPEPQLLVDSAPVHVSPSSVAPPIPWPQAS